MSVDPLAIIRAMQESEANMLALRRRCWAGIQEVDLLAKRTAVVGRRGRRIRGVGSMPRAVMVVILEQVSHW